MTNYYAAFVHGADKFPLDGTYELFLAQDYTPPGVNVLASFASGTLRNRMSGGEVTSKQHIDRDLSIPILTKGSSQADTHGVIRNLESFIERSLSLENASEKLYFIFCPSDAVPYTPIWGQQYYKYEVKLNNGAFVDREIYLTSDVREKFIQWRLPLTIGPFATGERQRVGSATGGILEHSWATEDGLSRGLEIPSAIGKQQITNPTFGHATWDTGWTAGAECLSSENTDKNYVMFGSSSAKLTAIGSTTNTFAASFTADNTNVHYFYGILKLPDGGVISASNLTMAYAGAGLTETYRAIGDGYYIVSGTAAGVAAARSLTFIPAEGVTIYLVYAHAVESPIYEPPVYGDMLDCAWSGTAYESYSTRTAARYRLPSGAWDPAEATFEIVWTPDTDSGDLAAGSYRVFYDDTNNLRLYYSAGASDVWALHDDTNSATSTANAHSAGDVIILHATVGPTNGLKIYKDGVQIATNATYTPAAAGQLYIGTSKTATEHTHGTYADFIIWDRELTAAEVLARANNISKYVNGGDGYGQRLNPIPWLWTDDGDDEVDNCYDADYQHFCMVDGIPGNVDALTEAIFTSSASTQDDLQTGTLYVNQVRSDVYRDPDNWCFEDLSGVANGAYCGGAYQQTSIGTAFTDISNKNISGDNSRWLQDMKLRSILVRLADASGDDFEMRVRYQLDTSTIILFNEGKANTATTANKMFGTQNFRMSEYYTLPGVQSDHNLYVGPQIKRISGTANMNFDFYHLAFDRLAKIDQRLEKNDATTKTHYSSELKKATDYYGSGNVIGGFPILADSSDVIELTPNVLNNLFFFMLYVTYTHYVEIPGPVSTAIEMYVTPRWSLL